MIQEFELKWEMQAAAGARCAICREAAGVQVGVGPVAELWATPYDVCDADVAQVLDWHFEIVEEQTLERAVIVGEERAERAREVRS